MLLMQISKEETYVTTEAIVATLLVAVVVASMEVPGVMLDESCGCSKLNIGWSHESSWRHFEIYNLYKYSCVIINWHNLYILGKCCSDGNIVYMNCNRHNNQPWCMVTVFRWECGRGQLLIPLEGYVGLIPTSSSINVVCGFPTLLFSCPVSTPSLYSFLLPH